MDQLTMDNSEMIWLMVDCFVINNYVMLLAVVWLFCDWRPDFEWLCDELAFAGYFCEKLTPVE